MKNLLKNISSLFLLFAFILFIYVFYRSEVFYNGEKHNYYFKYYVFSLILIILSLISYLLKQNTKKNILTFLTSLIFTAYILEGFLTFFDYSSFVNKELREKRKNIKKSNINFDNRTLYEVYNDRLKENKNLVAKIKPSYHFFKEYSLRPMSGISHSETLYCNENGYYVFYESDRYGFRNLDSNWENKNEIMILGDSFAHGSCINDEIIISNLLNFNTLNLSYVGMGPLSQLATLKEYYPSVKPEIVLWFYSEGNDLFNLGFELKDKTLKKYLNKEKFSQQLVNRQKEIDKTNIKILENEIANFKKEHFRKYKKFVKLTELRLLSVERLSKKKIEKEFSYTKHLGNFEEILLKAKNYLDLQNTKLIFIYTPQVYRYMNSENQIKMKHYLQDYQKVIEILERNKINYFDLHKNILDKKKDPLDFYPFRSVGHFNEKGYMLIASEINSFIKEFLTPKKN